VTYGDWSQDDRGIGLVITANFGRGHGTDNDKDLGYCNNRQGNMSERVNEGGWVVALYVCELDQVGRDPNTPSRVNNVQLSTNT